MYGIGVLAFIFRGSVELQGPYLPVWAVWPDFEGGVCSAMTGQVPGPTSGTPPPRVARKRIVYPTPPMPHAGPLRYRQGIGASAEGDDSGQGDCESRRGESAEYPIQGIPGQARIYHRCLTR